MKRRDFILSIAAMLIAFAALHLSAQQPPGFGTYGYDGAGNVTAVGNDAFVYDELGRIRRASLLQGSTAHVQDFTYDRYGNIRTITTSGESNPAVPAVDERTNRINLATSATNMVGTYDAAGNLTWYNGIDAFRYDALNVMTESSVGGERRVYLYSASNERIATLNVAGNAITSSQWTLRDASAKVLRRLSRDAAGTWRWDEDYIYRGSQLLAAEVPGNTLHFHLDHLGTPRVITGNGGVRIAAHTYYSFGRELTPPGSERMKFTGHERDATNLDYMHARSYLPWTGRFLSVDPVMDIKRAMREPQGWNRYAYVMNNPVKSIDPDGRETFVLIVGPAGVDNPKGFAGHTALFVTSKEGRQAGVSYGGAHDFKRAGILGFINDYTAGGRSVTVYKLKTTPEQDAKMVDFLKKNPDGGVNPDAGTLARNMVTENCTTAACNALKTGGVVGQNEDLNGAASGAHKPSELKQSLEPGGDLSNRVQQKWVFEPEKKEKKEQQ